jgi:hypothetical protein
VRPVAPRHRLRQGERAVDRGGLRRAQHEKERVTGIGDQLVQAQAAAAPFERRSVADPEADLRAARRGRRRGHGIVDDRAPIVAEGDLRLGDGGEPTALGSARSWTRARRAATSRRSARASASSPERAMANATGRRSAS